MKHMHQRSRALVALALTLVMAGHRVTRADDPAMKERAQVEFHMLGSSRGGATTHFGAVTQKGRVEGELPQWYLQAWSLTSNGSSRCSGFKSSTSMESPDLGGADAPFVVWQVEAKVARVETDQVELEYAWKRVKPVQDGQTPTSGHDKVVLPENGRVLLDFVSGTGAGLRNECFQNVALEVVASIAEDSAFENKRIAYDLWLVSETGGKRSTKRLTLEGKQGEKVSFDYAALRSRLEGLSAAEDSILETTVAGQVRGRMQADGTVEIQLHAERQARGGARDWAVYAGGDKTVRAAAGETLRLELPPPAQVEQLKNAAVVQAAMASQQVSLVLTATPID